MLLHEENEEDEDEESVKIIILPVLHTSYVTFYPFFACSYVLHLDVLRRQIEIETEVKTNMYGYNAGPPMVYRTV